MLVIRLQRTGRSGHAQFRLIAQDSRFSPSKGRVVAYLGSYNPHTKEASIDSEKAGQYLANGAQPSDRAARLLKEQGVKLPSWVKLSDPKQRTTRNPEKRRSTAPAEPVTETPAEEAVTEEAPAEAPADAASAEEAPAKESPAEAPAEEAVPEAPAEPAAAEEDTSEAA